MKRALAAPSILVLLVVASTAAFARRMSDVDATIVMGMAATATWLAAGLVMLRNARGLRGLTRVGWRVLGAGQLVTVAGAVISSLLFAAERDGQWFGWTDVVYLTAYLVVIGAVVMFVRDIGDTGREVRLLIDGVIGGTAAAVILWAVFLSGILPRLDSASPWEHFVAVAYPALDITCFTLMLVLALQRDSRRFDPGFLFLSAAFLIQAVANLDLIRDSLGGPADSAPGAMTLYLFSAGLFFAAGASIRPNRGRREFAERLVSPWVWVAPYTLAVVLFGLAVSDRLFAGDLRSRGIQAGFLVVVLLVVARQTLAIRSTRVEVERERSALVSSISHELRTPLTAVVGFLRLLVADDLGMTADDRRELIGTSLAQAELLARIVNDLVHLSREDLDRITLETAPIAIVDVVDSAIGALDLRGVVEVQIPDDLVVSADGGRLLQVLTNYLANAARYGGGRIHVVASRGRRAVTVEVHDDGPGVPVVHQARIWNRFERGANRFNTETQGSGIGLAVVKAIVEGHGGEVGYRPSERLGGACFFFEIPGTDVPMESLDAAGGVRIG